MAFPIQRIYHLKMHSSGYCGSVIIRIINNVAYDGKKDGDYDPIQGKPIAINNPVEIGSFFKINVSSN
ncbi:hypothetical protein BSK56_14445 [Paenibacillus borealis]|uniref:Uncharacterized protein n=1 Tax=Paenibacillus borealis TaxID=160799 RepID=A0ABX3HBX7_PAEBO|nr:hypothetical protein BSK56_14445 [Paenibacillus borealis]